MGCIFGEVFESTNEVIFNVGKSEQDRLFLPMLIVLPPGLAIAQPKQEHIKRDFRALRSVQRALAKMLQFTNDSMEVIFAG